MPTIKETLEMCKVVIDGLAVGADISVHRASMLELSHYIASSIESLDAYVCTCENVKMSAVIGGRHAVCGKLFVVNHDMEEE